MRIQLLALPLTYQTAKANHSHLKISIMNTIQQIKDHAAAIMTKGAPFTKDELKVLKIFNTMAGGKAFNAGKRNAKAENQRLIDKR